ncbi:hypothetical protein CR513_24069, partial [Mucuna pruriens]
ALESDSEDGRPPSWIDPGVMEVHSVYTWSDSLVGMANAICSRGPWEVVCLWANERREPYFYFYETMFSKFGIRLLFSGFERVVLWALNVAPTQLHPNSWAFVRAFKLLCEDMGREPSLSVFFWYFSLHQADKLQAVQRSLLMSGGRSDGTESTLSDQPTIFVMVAYNQLEDWEREFIEELKQLPTLSCSQLIFDKRYCLVEGALPIHYSSGHGGGVPTVSRWAG